MPRSPSISANIRFRRPSTWRSRTSAISAPARPRAICDGTTYGLRNGGFEDGYILGDNYIKGAFFGPQHQEVGGVFKQDLYTGAFGAKR